MQPPDQLSRLCFIFYTSLLLRPRINGSFTLVLHSQLGFCHQSIPNRCSTPIVRQTEQEHKGPSCLNLESERSVIHEK